MSKQQQVVGLGRRIAVRRPIGLCRPRTCFISTQLKDKLDVMLARESRMELAASCFRFLPDRARLDLAGWAHGGRCRAFVTGSGQLSGHIRSGFLGRPICRMPSRILNRGNHRPVDHVRARRQGQATVTSPPANRGDGAQAFVRARGHSRRVRFLRIAVPAVIVLATGATWLVSWLDPMKMLVAGMPIDAGKACHLRHQDHHGRRRSFPDIRVTIAGMS